MSKSLAPFQLFLPHAKKEQRADSQSYRAASRIDFDVEILDSFNIYQILPAFFARSKDEQPGEGAVYFLSESADTSLIENDIMENN